MDELNTATVTGTRMLLQRSPIASESSVLGKTGWSVSPVGLGCYRVSDEEPGHREALRLALLSGCNLIDTSTNYGNGHSELLVGQVLSELIGAGKLKRDEVVIVTKAGYVQGDNLALVRERERQGRPFSELVRYQPGCWHCISPDFLEGQITRSLERLQTQRIDALLLHNPEYYLKTEPNHSEYYRRIQAAFKHLETEVKRGRIQYYGVSSNTFPEPKDSPEYTSLETLIGLAEELGSDNHFALIQFPFNLFEPGAAFENNNSGKTVLELAQLKGLGTLINRPLNAFHENKLIRIAEAPSRSASLDPKKDLESSLGHALDLEARLIRESSESGATPLPIKPSEVAWGHILRENLQQLDDLEHWQHALSRQILPALQGGLSKLSALPAYRGWAEEYSRVSEDLFESVTGFLESKSGNIAKRIAAALDRGTPELTTSRSLAQKAIRVYRSIPGLHCVLLGMRRTDYVRDGLTLAPRLTPEQAMDAMDAVIESAL